MRARDPAAKALIFTQFIGTLEWLAQRLQEEGYGYRTISGKMHLNKRAQVLVCSFLAACNPCYTLQTRKLQSYHLTDANRPICRHS